MQDIIRRRDINKNSDNNISDKQKDVTINKKNSNGEPARNQSIPLRVLSRVVVIFSLLIVVYFSSSKEKLEIFARQSEFLPGKGVIIKCSSEFMKEIDKYEGCLQSECKRFVTDTVVNITEAEGLLAIAKKGLKFGGSSGGASILDLNSGALSKGENFINIFKHGKAQNLFTEQDFSLYQTVKDKIKSSIATHFGVHPNKIHLTHPTFFSEITPKKAVTVHDEYWHPHVDKETYKSFHYTSLLYLGDYGVDFDGGRFVFVDMNVKRSIEPRKGRVIMFTSGAENLHYVEKVTLGTRYAVTISFTCDKQYAIEDPSISKYKN